MNATRNNSENFMNSGEEYKLVAEWSVPGEPTSKARARFTKVGSKTVAYTPEKTKQGEYRVAWGFRAAGGRFNKDTETAYAVHATFFNGTMQRRDVDNMLKMILDSLNGVAYPDDTQVLEVWGRKTKVKKADARTEIKLYSIGTIGRPMKACIRCGEKFVTYESWDKNPNGRKYCSPDCAYAHRVEQKQRTCENCNKQFQSWGKKRVPRFCSKECRSDFGKIEIECFICGTAFIQFKSWANDRSICKSVECRRARNRIAYRERRTKHFPGTCLICGGGTTRKEYKRCNPCKLDGKVVPESAAS